MVTSACFPPDGIVCRGIHYSDVALPSSTLGTGKWPSGYTARVFSKGCRYQTLAQCWLNAGCVCMGGDGTPIRLQPNVVSMLGQRLQRWPNIETTSGRRGLLGMIQYINICRTTGNNHFYTCDQRQTANPGHHREQLIIYG